MIAAPLYDTEPDDERLQGYVITNEKKLLNVDFIHSYLSNNSKWAHNIPREVVERAIEHSLCFGAFQTKGDQTSGDKLQQVGFARIVTDYATFAYWCDVFVVDEHRGFGLARWLMREMIDHPALQGLRKLALYTSKAHNFYRELGFTPLQNPENWLELHRPDIYSEKN